MDAVVSFTKKIPLQMYCCTNRDGRIIPMKFKYEDDSQQRHTCVVIKVVEFKEYTGSNIDYDLVIEDDGFQQKVRVCYHINRHFWEILL